MLFMILSQCTAILFLMRCTNIAHPKAQALIRPERSYLVTKAFRTALPFQSYRLI